jgi:hypothetical protein
VGAWMRGLSSSGGDARPWRHVCCQEGISDMVYILVSSPPAVADGSWTVREIDSAVVDFLDLVR